MRARAADAQVSTTPKTEKKIKSTILLKRNFTGKTTNFEPIKSS